jgi:hypothetical protein
MTTVLNTINAELNSIGVPYEFMRWTSAVNGAYFVGEISETPTDTEDGGKEYSLILTGTTRGSWLELENYRAKIEDHFPTVYGLRKSTDDGAVVIFYSHSFPVKTGEAEVKRIQINLQIKQWKGMN